MATACIPVDILNPGQVFACLGFLEAAEILLGNAEGGFHWDDGEPEFSLSAGSPDDQENPFEEVLAFLAESEPRRFGPFGYSDPPPEKASAEDHDEPSDDDKGGAVSSLDLEPYFPAKAGDRMALPIRLGAGNKPVVELAHWADGSSRENFKLYSGNRSADRIARAMLQGVRRKPSKKQSANGQPGDLKLKGIAQLWEDDRDSLVRAPFDILTTMGGSFNFDPRGAWTAIDAGYSPNDQKHGVNASPVVELLAAWGLENARPVQSGQRQVRYWVWRGPLPPALARAAFAGGIPAVRSRRFRFQLDLSGKNKVVTFAHEEPQI